MPLDAIVGHVVTPDPDHPQNSRPHHSPKPSNHPEAFGNTVGKNALLLVDRGPPPSMPRAIGKYFNDIQTPVPSLLRGHVLPKAVQNSLSHAHSTNRAALYDVVIHDSIPRIHLHRPMPDSPH
jgi:hypothetical protein